MRTQPVSFTISLPAWCVEFSKTLPERLQSDHDAMRLAIDLSRRNVVEDTGGPFAAVVSAIDDGRIIAIGVNRVEPDHCSSAHGEIVALSLAQSRLGSFDLSAAETGPLQLATSCEPCAMCLGAIPWSGIKRLVCGATKADAAATGFDEGERIDDWIGMLNRRGIRVETGILRADAARVLEDYRKRGARIYNPSRPDTEV
ncbi:MAG: nucleoside deaminase [Wenzhouxiangellaceae bacterium]|nr:nucleoside deaminase [Wenzhouxiangellaceae bacterium]